MELNREQIIKALEHCINRKDCSDCVIKSKERGSGCLGRPRAFFKNALSLIKELIEERDAAIVASKMSGVPFPDGLEIVHTFCQKEIKKAKADTVRNMQERLEAEAITIKDHTGKLGIVVVGTIDQIAKEMLEGKNVSG